MGSAQKAKVHSPQAIAAGGVIGATVGGLVLAAITLASAGTALIAVPVLVGGGAIAGTFAAAIYSIENARGDYYDRALTEGHILVAVEIHGQGNISRLEQAERILADAGGNVEAVGGYP